MRVRAICMMSVVVGMMGCNAQFPMGSEVRASPQMGMADYGSQGEPGGRIRYEPGAGTNVQLAHPGRMVQPQPSAMADEGLVRSFNEAVGWVTGLRYAEAAGRFDVLEGQFEAAGDVERAAESVFWYGFCLEKLGKAAESRAAYGRVIEKYPGTRARQQAEVRLAGMEE